MPSLIDWSSLGGELDDMRNKTQAVTSKDRVPFLKFESGKTYLIRPVGNAYRFYKAFVNGKPLVIDLEHKQTAEKILNEHTGGQVKLESRFAMFVIDRTDGKVKVFEGNQKMMTAFANWSSVTKASPGSQEGGDWSISVTGEKKERRYQTGFVRPCPVTQSEVDMLKSMKDKLVIEEIFKATPIDKLVERLTSPSQSPAPGNVQLSTPAVSPSPQNIW